MKRDAHEGPGEGEPRYWPYSAIKRCHQLGIRVIACVVMSHAKRCPLEQLAKDWFFLGSPADEGREHDWGGRCFRFETPARDDWFLAREFLAPWRSSG